MSAAANGRPKVLVKEKIGDSGVALLREHFDVDLGVDWSDEQLIERIGDYDGILIRSATKLDVPTLTSGPDAAPVSIRVMIPSSATVTVHSRAQPCGRRADSSWYCFILTVAV